MALHALGAACAFGVGVWLLIRHMPPEARAVAAGERQYDKRRWTKGALIFAAIYVMHTINGQADVVILGMFMSSADVGVYKVAAQTAALVAFTLTAVNITIGPQISRLYATGDLPKLQSMVTWSARGILFLTLPVAVALVIGGKFVLDKAFGSEFVEGHAVLVVLVLAQLFNAFMGPVGQLQNMTGHERDTVWAIGAAATLNVALNVLLIPHFGMLGAALAAASSITAWNVILWYSARRRMGIDSMAIRLFAPKMPGST
jgi:O-antigen/teichoic acid export membrane protein